MGESYRRWPCRTNELATTSLSQIAGFVPAVALPWFEQFRAPEDLNERVDRLLLGRILEASGARSRAHAAYLEDEKRLQAQLLEAKAMKKSSDTDAQMDVLVEKLLPAVHRALGRTADGA